MGDGEVTSGNQSFSDPPLLTVNICHLAVAPTFSGNRPTGRRRRGTATGLPPDGSEVHGGGGGGGGQILGIYTLSLQYRTTNAAEYTGSVARSFKRRRRARFENVRGIA